MTESKNLINFDLDIKAQEGDIRQETSSYTISPIIKKEPNLTEKKRSLRIWRQLFGTIFYISLYVTIVVLGSMAFYW